MDAAWLGRRREEADNEKSQGDQGHGPEPAADVLRALQHLPGDRIQGLVVAPGLLPRQQPRQVQVSGCQEVEGMLTRLCRDLGVSYGSRGHLALLPTPLRATTAYPHQVQPIRASDRSR